MTVEVKRRMKKQNSILAILALLVIVMVIAGCGSKTIASSAEVVKETKQPIKVGVILALTGGAAMYGNPMLDAMTLAVEEINSKGGIGGRAIEFVVEDGQCQPTPAANAAQKLVNMDKVEVILGGLCSSETLAVAPIVEAAHVTLLSPSSTSPAITKAGDFIFRDIASDLAQATVGAKMMYDAGLREVAVLVVNDDYGIGIRDAFVSHFEKLGGTVTTTVTLEKEGKDYRTELMKVKDSKPEAFYLAAFPKEAGLALKQSAEIGMDVPVFGTEVLNDGSLVEVAGNAADGLKITVPAAGTGSVYADFKSSYNAKFGRDPEAYTAESYDAVFLIADALKKTDGSGEKIKDELYQTRFVGASGVIVFNADGDPVDKEYDVLELTSGTFVNIGKV